MLTMDGASGDRHCKRAHTHFTCRGLIRGLLLVILFPVLPAMAQNLTGPEAVKLVWTAPGDDGYTGQANAYDIRVSFNPITASTWNGATAVANPPSPSAPGSRDSVVISGLEKGVTYYAAIRTADEVPNWSAVSNNVQIYLTPDSTAVTAEPEFAVTPAQGSAPLTVAFTNLTTETPLGWRWDFGDGNYSAEQHPSHIYAAPGTYTVTLTAYWSSDTTAISKPGCVVVGSEEVVVEPNFEATPEQGIAPVTVTFTNLTTETPLAWRWDFGDGYYATEMHPTHTYTSPGTYAITLTAYWSADTTSLTRPGYVVIDDLSGNTSEQISPNGEVAVRGTVTGSYAALAGQDGMTQRLTEIESGGKPELRHSELEHQWTLEVPLSGVLSFHAWASRPGNTDGDDFLFEYSAGGEPFRSLVAVTDATLTHYQAFVPAGVHGAVTIRVVDTDKSSGNRSLDGVEIDQMYIECEGSPVAPDTVYVGWVQTGQSEEPSKKFHAQAIVYVEASRGFPASGVEVWGHFEGVVGGSSSAVTASTGEAEFLSDKTRDVQGDWTFYVDSLGANGRIYSSGLNLASSAAGRFEPGMLPVSPELYANYPNPFNPETNIEFWLPQAEEVRLSVYNALGQEVAVLIDGERHAAGSHTVLWEAGGFASGVYFYRLAAGAAVETRKMMLLK